MCVRCVWERVCVCVCVCVKYCKSKSVRREIVVKIEWLSEIHFERDSSINNFLRFYFRFLFHLSPFHLYRAFRRFGRAFPGKFTVLVYFSGPWEHFLALWQYFKIILFQITNKTNLTWPYLTNLTSPSLTLPGAMKDPLLKP
jgi:hypothetical protein